MDGLGDFMPYTPAAKRKIGIGRLDGKNGIFKMNVSFNVQVVKVVNNVCGTIELGGVPIDTYNVRPKLCSLIVLAATPITGKSLSSFILIA